MKINELRIGNFVTLENDVWNEYSSMTMRITKIDSETDDMFPDSTGSAELLPENGIYTFAQFDEFIKPIPLTEEWLLKFGFDGNNALGGCGEIEISTNGNFRTALLGGLSNNGVRCQIYTEKIPNPYNEIFNQCSIPLQIKYVHQLQNLYFALTGEELTC